MFYLLIDVSRNLTVDVYCLVPMSVVWWDRHRHHIMNVNQYPATHNANYNSMVLRTSDFPNFIQAKPLFKQFMLWQGLWLSWASWEGHFLFLFWRQKWKVLSLICACPCYLSYLCLGRLTGDKASWQPPPGVLITVRCSSVIMSHSHLQQKQSYLLLKV